MARWGVSVSAAAWCGDKVPCLCNDCLRVVPLSVDEMMQQQDDNGIIACECGGDNGPCWCSGCVETARRLLAGERRAAALGLHNCGEVVSWSIAEGLRK